jgi:type I restriction enzyme S subunit
MKLRRICRVQQGLQIAQTNRYAEPGPNRFEYITVKSIHADDTLISKEYIEKPPQSVLCASDDILLARTGATGEVFSDQTGVFHNNFFKVIYDRKLVDKNYLIYYLSDIKIKKHLIMLAGTTTIPDLNHGDFLDTPFSYPTFDEQKNIVIFLDRETARIANLTNKIRESISKLHEYRTALISAAVTGKIDVREELVP